MNEFGGFDGREIELSTIDERALELGVAAASDWSTLDALDAVIGPFSSSGSLVIVPQLISRGTVVCSPSISSTDFDQLVDDGLFFRTSTLDSEILSGMVDIAVRTGSDKVAVVFPDDFHGRRLMTELNGLLSERELEISASVPYSPSESDIQPIVEAIVNDDSSVELLIGEPVGAPRIVTALLNRPEPEIIIINDALTDSTLEIPRSIDPTARPKVFGVVADLRKGDRKLLNDFSFGTSQYLRQLTEIPTFGVNTVECLTSIWLAARSANSDDSQLFKNFLVDNSKNGSRCTWIFDCSFLLDQSLNLDYEGSSSLTFDQLGNAVDRGILVYTFDDQGRVVEAQEPLELTPSEDDVLQPKP